MASLHAKAVATEVIRNIRKPTGKKDSLKKIIKKHGYSESIADHPSTVLRTKSAQEIINPIIESMMKERIEVMKRMVKVRNKARYRDLVDSMDKLTKNIQLLGGNPTDNIALGIMVLPAKHDDE